MSAAMADDKERHYWTQLQAALVAGHWDATSPAKALNGYPLSWSELFRKFKKHSKQPGPAEAALQTHFISLLLKASKFTTREINGGVDEPSPDDFALGKEYILFEERREDAQKAYDSLQQLGTSDDLAKLTLAYCAYALDQPRDCLEHISTVKFGDTLKAAHASKPSLLVTSSANEKAGDTSSVLFSSPADVEDANAWLLMETVRAACLEGMSHERLSPGSPAVALEAYDKGCSFLKSFSIPKSLPTRTGKTNLDSFTRYRELWRWTDMILWRAISLSARHRDIVDTLPLFRTYMTHSVHWSATFRSSHRQMIFALYLRTLILFEDLLPSPLFASKAAWSTEIRSVTTEYRVLLSATTSFPRAGERNVLVEEFVDYCVACWASCGSAPDQAAWVIDILWWAMRFTFNCPKILRHMTRLLHVSGDHELAKRTLKIYVQIVGKAHQTMSNSSMGSTADPEEVVGFDDDRHWVQTLVQGARMLCRIPGDADDAKLALSLCAQARTRIDNVTSELRSIVDMTEGICRSILAIREHRVDSRQKQFSDSVVLLRRSVELNPSASAHYHLALLLSRPIPEHDLDEAVKHCREAIERDPKELRHWHLLALLEAKMGEWAKARGVLDVAIEIAEDAETNLRTIETKESGILSKDYAAGPDTIENAQLPSAVNVNGTLSNGQAQSAAAPRTVLIDPDRCRIPPASELIKPLADHPAATPREQFDQTLQLRMTQLALTELVEGPESVEPYWLEVFEWYSQRRETDPVPRSARPSLDTRLDHTPRSFSVAELDRPFSRQSTDISVIGPSNSSMASSQPRESSIASTDAPTITSPARTSINTSTQSSQDGRATPQQQNAASTSQAASGTTTIAHRKSRLRLRARSQSPDREKDNSKGKGKRVQKMLKTQVHNTQVRINTISKKIGHGMTKGAGLQRSSSAPNFHEILTRSRPYQASSIHSRKRLSWVPRANRGSGRQDGGSVTSPPPLPPPLPPVTHEQFSSNNKRSVRERRLLSDLWLMSAATFRRLEKLEQARAAIQEAESLDEENENVWVQLGLYFLARGEESKAIESFYKALFISQADVSATLHLANLYLSSQSTTIRSSAYGAVDLAVGLLEGATNGTGWDSSEAWYLLAKAYHMQTRPDHERECLMEALSLSEARGARDIGLAVGWCL